MGWVADGDAAFFLNGAEDGGFEAGEGEVETVDFGVGEAIFVGVAFFCGLSDGGAAGVGEAEDFGDFVEAFADGVVQSGADDVEVVVLGHADDLSVAAGDDESQKREGRCLLACEPV